MKTICQMDVLDSILKYLFVFLKEDYDTMCSILLSILGIVITIFTVVYSFMETTFQKISLLEIENRNAIEADPVRRSSLKFSKRYLMLLKKFNRKIKYLIFINIFLLVLYLFFSFCLNNEWLRIVYNSLSILYLLSCAMVLVQYIGDYNKRYK